MDRKELHSLCKKIAWLRTDTKQDEEKLTNEIENLCLQYARHPAPLIQEKAKCESDKKMIDDNDPHVLHKKRKDLAIEVDQILTRISEQTCSIEQLMHFVSDLEQDKFNQLWQGTKLEVIVQKLKQISEACVLIVEDEAAPIDSHDAYGMLCEKIPSVIKSSPLTKEEKKFLAEMPMALPKDCRE